MLGALFGHRKPPAQADSSTSAAPLPTSLGIVAQQPVYNAQLQPCAQEYGVRSALLAGQNARAHHAHFDQLLLQTLGQLQLLGTGSARQAYVRLHTSAALASDALQQLAPEQMTLLIDSWPLTAFDSPTRQQLHALKQQGYRFAMLPLAGERLLPAPLLALADSFVFDLNASAKSVLSGLLGPLRQQAPQTLWHLRNIGSEEAFQACVKAVGPRLAHYHGAFFAHYRPQVAARSAPARLRVLEILRLLRAQAPLDEIERQFKLDSALLFKLLRYINSPANGLARKIQTLDETLQLMGRDTLFKWLSLLLYSSGQPVAGSQALLERSLTRARLLENLGRAQGCARLECEHLFLTGMFSQLDQLLGVPLAQAIAPLELPATLVQALLNGGGLFAPHLGLAQALEAEDNAQAALLCRILALPASSVSRCALDAANWAQSVAAGNA